MRVEMRVDGIIRTIDSRNPDLLAQWLLEIFSEVEWNAATECRVWCWPSFAPPGPRGPRRDWADSLPDWVTDSRFLGFPVEAKSPEELLDSLGEQLRAYREAQK
jgi:hypothetical protein